MSEEVGAEVAVRGGDAGAVRSFEGASEGIVTFLADLSVAYEIARRLVATSFVPQSYQNKPQEAAAAIVAGQGVGLGPMESLRSIDIIQGTPAMRAITLRALVVSRGHEIWLEESTPTRAVVCGRRAGSEKVQRSEWDLDRARALGLLNKDNWKKQPSAMLIARATSECARLIAPDALLGIPYSTEELQDLDGEQTHAAPKPARRVRTLAARASAADAAPSDETPVEAEGVDAAAALDEHTEHTEVTEGFVCSNCGEPRAAEDGGICEPCEADIEAAAVAAENEGGRA